MIAKAMPYSTTMNIVIILISVLLNCAAQIFIRKGMMAIGAVGIEGFVHNIWNIITNLWLWAAFLSYAVSIVLWMIVLSRVQVSFAYPFLSIGYVVAAVIGYYFLGENMNAYRIAGIAVICIGVYLISRS